MQAIQALKREHVLIARALSVVERAAARLPVGSAMDREVMVLLLEFCQAFADSYHQRKEEFLLIPWLRNAGAEFEENPMVRLRRNHARTRELLRTLAGEGAGNLEVTARLLECLRELVSHLRAQIAFEEGVVFRTAEQLEGAAASLDEAFQDLEDGSEGVEERAREIVAALEARFGPEP